MTNGINFVVKRVDPKTQELQRKLRLLRLGALVVLTGVTLVSGVLFTLIAASPLPALRQEEEEIFSSLNAVNTKVQKALLVDKQLEHVQTVMASRSDLPVVIDELLQNTPPTLRIISYSATDEQMELTIEADRLSDIDDFITTITGLSEEEKLFRNVTLENLNISPSQSAYQFRITMRN